MGAQSGTGPGGTVAVSVAGDAVLLNTGSVTSSTFGRGDAGDVVVGVGGALTIDGAGAPPGSLTGISSTAAHGSKGAAGTVTVSAGSLTLLNEGTITSGTFGPGNAGEVVVGVGGALTIGGAALSVSLLTVLCAMAGAVMLTALGIYGRRNHLIGA